jgi:uncharacterized membrane protein
MLAHSMTLYSDGASAMATISEREVLAISGAAIGATVGALVGSLFGFVWSAIGAFVGAHIGAAARRARFEQ